MSDIPNIKETKSFSTSFSFTIGSYSPSSSTSSSRSNSPDIFLKNSNIEHSKNYFELSQFSTETNANQFQETSSNEVLENNLIENAEAPTDESEIQDLPHTDSNSIKPKGIRRKAFAEIIDIQQTTINTEDINQTKPEISTQNFIYKNNNSEYVEIKKEISHKQETTRLSPVEETLKINVLSIIDSKADLEPQEKGFFLTTIPDSDNELDTEEININIKNEAKIDTDSQATKIHKNKTDLTVTQPNKDIKDNIEQNSIKETLITTEDNIKSDPITEKANDNCKKIFATKPQLHDFNNLVICKEGVRRKKTKKEEQISKSETTIKQHTFTEKTEVSNIDGKKVVTDIITENENLKEIKSDLTHIEECKTTDKENEKSDVKQITDSKITITGDEKQKLENIITVKNNEDQANKSNDSSDYIENKTESNVKQLSKIECATEDKKNLSNTEIKELSNAENAKVQIIKEESNLKSKENKVNASIETNTTNINLENSIEKNYKENNSNQVVDQLPILLNTKTNQAKKNSKKHNDKSVYPTQNVSKATSISMVEIESIDLKIEENKLVGIEEKTHEKVIDLQTAESSECYLEHDEITVQSSHTEIDGIFDCEKVEINNSINNAIPEQKTLCSSQLDNNLSKNNSSKNEKSFKNCDIEKQMENIEVSKVTEISANTINEKKEICTDMKSVEVKKDDCSKSSTESKKIDTLEKNEDNLNVIQMKTKKQKSLESRKSKKSKQLNNEKDENKVEPKTINKDTKVTSVTTNNDSEVIEQQEIICVEDTLDKSITVETQSNAKCKSTIGNEKETDIEENVTKQDSVDKSIDEQLKRAFLEEIENEYDTYDSALDLVDVETIEKSTCLLEEGSQAIKSECNEKTSNNHGDMTKPISPNSTLETDETLDQQSDVILNENNQNVDVEYKEDIQFTEKSCFKENDQIIESHENIIKLSNKGIEKSSLIEKTDYVTFEDTDSPPPLEEISKETEFLDATRLNIAANKLYQINKAQNNIETDLKINENSQDEAPTKATSHNKNRNTKKNKKKEINEEKLKEQVDGVQSNSRDVVDNDNKIKLEGTKHIINNIKNGCEDKMKELSTVKAEGDMNDDTRKKNRKKKKNTPNQISQQETQYDLETLVYSSKHESADATVEMKNKEKINRVEAKDTVINNETSELEVGSVKDEESNTYETVVKSQKKRKSKGKQLDQPKKDEQMQHLIIEGNKETSDVELKPNKNDRELNAKSLESEIAKVQQNTTEEPQQKSGTKISVIKPVNEFEPEEKLQTQSGQNFSQTTEVLPIKMNYSEKLKENLIITKRNDSDMLISDTTQKKKKENNLNELKSEVCIETEKSSAIINKKNESNTSRQNFNESKSEKPYKRRGFNKKVNAELNEKAMVEDLNKNEDNKSGDWNLINESECYSSMNNTISGNKSDLGDIEDSANGEFTEITSKSQRNRLSNRRGTRGRGLGRGFDGRIRERESTMRGRGSRGIERGTTRNISRGRGFNKGRGRGLDRAEIGSDRDSPIIEDGIEKQSKRGSGTFRIRSNNTPEKRGRQTPTGKRNIDISGGPSNSIRGQGRGRRPNRRPGRGFRSDRSNRSRNTSLNEETPVGIIDETKEKYESTSIDIQTKEEINEIKTNLPLDKTEHKMPTKTYIETVSIQKFNIGLFESSTMSYRDCLLKNISSSTAYNALVDQDSCVNKTQINSEVLETKTSKYVSKDKDAIVFYKEEMGTPSVQNVVQEAHVTDKNKTGMDIATDNSKTELNRNRRKTKDKIKKEISEDNVIIAKENTVENIDSSPEKLLNIKDEIDLHAAEEENNCKLSENSTKINEQLSETISNEEVLPNEKTEVCVSSEKNTLNDSPQKPTQQSPEEPKELLKNSNNEDSRSNKKKKNKNKEKSAHEKDGSGLKISLDSSNDKVIDSAGNEIDKNISQKVDNHEIKIKVKKENNSDNKDKNKEDFETNLNEKTNKNKKGKQKNKSADKGEPSEKEKNNKNAEENAKKEQSEPKEDQIINIYLVKEEKENSKSNLKPTTEEEEFNDPNKIPFIDDDATMNEQKENEAKNQKSKTENKKRKGKSEINQNVHEIDKNAVKAEVKIELSATISATTKETKIEEIMPEEKRKKETKTEETVTGEEPIKETITEETTEKAITAETATKVAITEDVIAEDTSTKEAITEESTQEIITEEATTNEKLTEETTEHIITEGEPAKEAITAEPTEEIITKDTTNGTITEKSNEEIIQEEATAKETITEAKREEIITEETTIKQTIAGETRTGEIMTEETITEETTEETIIKCIYNVDLEVPKLTSSNNSDDSDGSTFELDSIDNNVVKHKSHTSDKHLKVKTNKTKKRMDQDSKATTEEVGMCAHCGELASHRCANCRLVFYCKKECQVAHWKNTHKDECKPFQIKENFQLGRYMVATRDLKAGDVIFKDDPLVVGPKQITEPVCLGCYKRVDGSYRCRKCTWPLCGPACESASDHQPECVLGQEMGSPIDIQNFDITNHFYELVLPFRCLALKKRSPKKYQQLKQLQCHFEDRKGTELYDSNQKRIVNMLRNYFLIVDFPPEQLDSSETGIHTVTGIIDVNGIEIRLPETEIIGLYPVFSMLEHSCTPNIKFKITEKRQVIVKAAVDIKAGEHLSTMYTNILWGTQGRRDHLKTSKYFLCSCRRCADPTELGTHFSALRCTNCPLGFQLSAAPLDENAPWICTNCDATTTSEEINERTLRIGEEVEEALAAPTLEGLETLIEKLSSSSVHPNHFHLFALKHTLLQFFGRDGRGLDEATVKKKEKVCQEFLKTCNALDPGLSRLAPYVGVALYEYHLAVLARARSDPSGEMQTVIKKDLETAKALLQQCVKVLVDEPADQPEGQLRHIAQENLKELLAWEASM